MQKVEDYKFDLAVLGGGVGGYTGAIRAAKSGMSVALIEADELGGTCLNRGCIPMKTLLHSSEIFRESEKFEELGICCQNIAFDEAKIYARKEAIVATLKEGVKSLLAANKVTVIKGRGWLVGKNLIEVGSQIVSAKYILLATGSRPSALKFEGAEYCKNSDGALGSPLKNDIVIIGGGVIGVELASYCADLKKNVTIVEAEQKILPSLSRDLSAQLALELKKRGVKIVTGACVQSVKKTENASEGFAVAIRCADGEKEMYCEEVVVAAGRRPNIEDIGLDAAGVEWGRFIKTDGFMRTSVDNIFACGDIVEGLQLAHFAAASAIVAVDTMAGREVGKDLSVVPSCVYTSPQIAVVGKTEGAKTGRFMMGANGKSLILGGGRGFVKVYADADGKISGAEIFSRQATEIIGELALAVQLKLSAEEAAKIVRAHPTVSESVGEAVEDILGLAIHKI
jgi:dihydrolipoamide dehydrogenase